MNDAKKIQISLKFLLEKSFNTELEHSGKKALDWIVPTGSPLEIPGQ